MVVTKAIHTMTDAELEIALDMWQEAWEVASEEYRDDDASYCAGKVERIEQEQDSREMARIEEWDADPS